MCTQNVRTERPRWPSNFFERGTGTPCCASTDCTQRRCAGSVPNKVPQRKHTRNVSGQRAQGAAPWAICEECAQGVAPRCRAHGAYAEAVHQQCAQMSCAGNARKECVQTTCARSGPHGVHAENVRKEWPRLAFGQCRRRISSEYSQSTRRVVQHGKILLVGEDILG